MSETSDRSTGLARNEPGWRGDEHRLQVDAAREAGLPASQAALDLFTRGFSAGMTLEDPADKAIVLRGRTVLRERELRKSLGPLLRYARVPIAEIGTRVHDGRFEVRIPGRIAERAAPALDSTKVALKLWIGFGLLGLALQPISGLLSAIVWAGALVAGGWTLRQGLANGRSMLAGRIVLGLAMLAQEEGLILPPAGDEPGGA